MLTFSVALLGSAQPYLISASAMLLLLSQVGESSHLALRLLSSLTHAADPSHSLTAHRILAGQLSEPAHTWSPLQSKHHARAGEGCAMQHTGQLRQMHLNPVR